MSKKVVDKRPRRVWVCFYPGRRKSSVLVPMGVTYLEDEAAMWAKEFGSKVTEYVIAGDAPAASRKPAVKSKSKAAKVTR